MSMLSTNYRCLLCPPTGIRRITRCGTCTNGKSPGNGSSCCSWMNYSTELDACWNSVDRQTYRQVYYIREQTLLRHAVLYCPTRRRRRGKWTLRSNRNQYQHFTGISFANCTDSVTNFGQGKLTTIRIIYNKTTVEFIVEGNWGVGHLFMNGPPLCAGQ